MSTVLPSPAATVLLATRDRAALLAGTLDALCHLAPPPGGWTLVVVDNGSRDATAELLAAYRPRLPLRVVREPRAGKNLALNAGLRAVEGALVVLTDDDVRPRADWLCRLLAAADAHPEAAVFGGTVRPAWEVEPAPGLVDWAPPGPCYTLVERAADGPGDLGTVLGPNMAIRAAVFARGIRFAETVGPDGSGDYPMGSETELLLRLQRAGYRFRYCKGAVVHHVVRREQLRPDWLLARAFRYGRGQHLLGYAGCRNDRAVLLARAIGPAGAAAVLNIVASLLARVGAPAHLQRRAEWKLHFLRGAADQARRDAGPAVAAAPAGAVLRRDET